MGFPYTYDDFSTSLDANHWTTVQGSPSTSGGVLVLTPGAAGVKQVKSTINLTGDFDIQADFVYTNTATDSWYFYMLVGDAASMPDGQDTNNYSYYMRVGRCYHTGAFIRNWYKGAGTGAPTLDGSVANTGTSSKFRLTRTDSTFKAYYDIGGGWVQVGAAAGISITSADVKIVLDALSLDSNPAPTTTVDNVVVNAGHINGTVAATMPKLTIVGNLTGVGGAASWPTTGQCKIPALTMYASGISSPLIAAPKGIMTLPKLRAAATDWIKGNAAVDLPSLTGAATGSVSNPGTAALKLRLLRSGGLTKAGNVGHGASTMPSPTVNIRTGVDVSGTMQPLTIAATGLSGQNGIGVMTLPKPTGSATGYYTVNINGAVTLQKMVSSGTWLRGNTLNEASTLRALQSASTGITGGKGTAVNTMPRTTGNATGYGKSTNTGTVRLHRLKAEGWRGW